MPGTVVHVRRVWLIRAGETGAEIDRMRHHRLIGLRCFGVTDARELTDLEIERAFVFAGHPGDAAARRTTLRWFELDVKAGDLIVSPNPARHEVWVGTVTGGYTYSAEPAIAGFEHTHEVDWLGWLDRDAGAMRDQQKLIDRPPVMYELYNRDWWWNHVEHKDLPKEPRPGRVRATGTRSRATGAGRANTPKPAPVARPKPPTAILCAGQCGLQWSPQALVGGICPDCRMD